MYDVKSLKEQFEDILTDGTREIVESQRMEQRAGQKFHRTVLWCNGSKLAVREICKEGTSYWFAEPEKHNSIQISAAGKIENIETNSPMTRTQWSQHLRFCGYKQYTVIAYYDKVVNVYEGESVVECGKPE